MGEGHIAILRSKAIQPPPIGRRLTEKRLEGYSPNLRHRLPDIPNEGLIVPLTTGMNGQMGRIRLDEKAVIWHRSDRQPLEVGSGSPVIADVPRESKVGIGERREPLVDHVRRTQETV